MKPGDVTKNFNGSCEYTYHSKNLMGFSTLLHLTVSNLIHAGILLLLFEIVLIFCGWNDACEIVLTVYCRPTIRLIQ